MLRIGVVGVQGGWSSEALADAFAARTKFRLLIDMERAVFDSERRGLVVDGHDLKELDALVIKKIGPRYSPDLFDRLELLNHLDEHGLRIYSRPKRLMRTIDRLSNTMALRIGGLPTPPTTITEDPAQALKAIEKYERAILKPLYTSKAQGMKMLEAGDLGLEGKLKRYREAGNTVYFVQKMVRSTARDLAVVFFGRRYIASYARVKEGDSWNTTIPAGGRYEPCDPGKHIIDIARRAQYLFSLDITEVDIVETPSGPMVLQVSAFGGFRGLTEGCGIDAAAAFADFIIEKFK